MDNRFAEVNVNGARRCPTSRITGGPVDELFSARVLGKYMVRYYRCRDTGFIQTESPYWLQEAYSSAISELDVGCVSRNLDLARCAVNIIDRCLPDADRFLDFGGGTGLFVRLMRDAGYAFIRSDPYCQNVFARGFDLEDTPRGDGRRCSLVTAFEVFEHVEHPKEVLEVLFSFGDTILFSTELQPTSEIKAATDWWYFVPETGQHIALYNVRALEYLAECFHACLYTDGSRLHMMTRDKSVRNPFERSLSVLSRGYRLLRRGLLGQWARNRVDVKQRRVSLLWHDFDFVRTRINDRIKTDKGEVGVTQNQTNCSAQEIRPHG